MNRVLALLIMCTFAMPVFAQNDSIPEYGSISGFVWDANTGNPIQDAHIVASGPGWGDAYTDSGGAYLVENLVAEYYEVTATALGYEAGYQCSVFVEENQTTAEVNFWLVPVDPPEYGSLSGYVWDANTGDPIAGACVFADGPSSEYDHTDQDGAYLVEDLVEGYYYVTAIASGYALSLYPCSVYVEANQNTPDINFWLEPQDTCQFGAISGNVWDANTGDAIPGAHVIAEGPSWGDAYTDSGGAYLITELAQGGYVLEASAPGYEPAYEETAYVWAGQTTTGINFWLNPTGGDTLTGIAGCITNAYSGTPILGALVEASGASGSGQASTNFYGEYCIQNLDAGWYEVNASAFGFESGFYPESVEVIDGCLTTGINIALVPLDTVGLGGISGRVTDAETGYPITIAQVFASGPNGQGYTYSDSFGIYLIDDLPEGNYEVRAAAYGYYPAAYPESVEVIGDNITPDIDFALTPSDTSGIAGFIIDGENGQAVSNAQITATGPSGTINVISNNIGDYLVDDLQSGIYYIEIEAQGYESATYPEGILVLSGWIEPFICPVLYSSEGISEHTLPDGNTLRSLLASPCPFVKASRISFEIVKKTNVQIAVFDATGRVVRDLYDDYLKPGSYSFNWDGADNSGKKVATGVYFFKVATDDDNITLKTIFMR